MSNVPDRATFERAYADRAPWDIAGPQAAFVAAASRITGSILDAGCGTGENAMFFAGGGHKVTGIDYLEEPIRRAKQKAVERRLPVNFLVMDALSLENLHETFDSVIDCGLFHVFSDDDRQKYVAGLAGVLKPSGRLYLMCFSDDEPGTLGPRRVAKSELQAAFTDHWQIESVEATQFAVIPAVSQMFSPGGPKAWFAIVKRIELGL